MDKIIKWLFFTEENCTGPSPLLLPQPGHYHLAKRRSLISGYATDAYPSCSCAVRQTDRPRPLVTGADERRRHRPVWPTGAIRRNGDRLATSCPILETTQRKCGNGLNEVLHESRAPASIYAVMRAFDQDLRAARKEIEPRWQVRKQFISGLVTDCEGLFHPQVPVIADRIYPSHFARWKQSQDV